MTKTARKTAAAAVVAIDVRTFMKAWGGAQGDGRATAFRNDPSEDTMQALLDAAEANLRGLMKGGKTAKSVKTTLKVVAKNEKATKGPAMIKLADATDAQIKRAYKAEFDKTLSTVAAMRKGLTKAGVKAIPAKIEKEAKPVKVAKKTTTKKVAKVDPKKAIAKLKTKIERLQDRRAATDDKAKRAKLMASIRELRQEIAELKA